MYVQDFDSFYQQARQLYEANPAATRFVLKYRNVDGKLVVKVTDDNTCLKYKTDQQSDLRKIERLNMMFFALMAKGEYTAEEDVQQQYQQQPGQASPAGKSRKQQGGRRRG